jgi:DNA-directed RNA polymerase beta' subunit
MIVHLDLIPSGYMVAQPAQIGTTDEEIAAIGRKEIAQSRVEELVIRLHTAASALHMVDAAGRC